MLRNQQQKQLWSLSHWNLLQKWELGISQKSFGVAEAEAEKPLGLFGFRLHDSPIDHTARPTPTLEKSLDWKTNIRMPGTDRWQALLEVSQVDINTADAWIRADSHPDAPLPPGCSALCCYCYRIQTDYGNRKVGEKLKLHLALLHQSVAFLSLSLSPPPSPFS